MRCKFSSCASHTGFPQVSLWHLGDSVQEGNKTNVTVLKWVTNHNGCLATTSESNKDSHSTNFFNAIILAFLFVAETIDPILFPVCWSFVQLHNHPASCSECPIWLALFFPSYCKRALCITGSRGPGQPLHLAQEWPPHLSDHLRVCFPFWLHHFWLVVVKNAQKITESVHWVWMVFPVTDQCCFPSEVQGQDDLDRRL